MINIDSGTFNQLKSLVEIRDTYARRIVDKRPYRCTDELVTKHVIPHATYDKIKERILTRPNNGRLTTTQKATNLTVGRVHLNDMKPKFWVT